MKKNFTLLDTFCAKGIATLFLLWHHLFFSIDYNFSSILKKEFIVQTATLSKICVAMFVFLSGLGLTASYNKKNPPISQFYKHVFIKWYLSYWCIFILALIPLFLEISGNGAYGKIDNISSVFITKEAFFQQLFGIHRWWGYHSWNATWWYCNIVVILYAVFPFLHKVVIKNPFEVLLIVCSSIYFLDIKLPFPINQVSQLLFPFVLGITVQNFNFFQNSIY